MIVSDFPTKSPPRWREMINSPGFYIAQSKLVTSFDSETRRWVRNASDELAASKGMRFSEKRGQFAVDWIQKYCTLYEGNKAGQLMQVEDWQYEFFMQMFGWQRKDDEIGRWIRRFTRASVWIPKKNGKSPTLAATGLYMLIGDGEPGQKCYSVARDGKQALIAHNHAIQMVLASPVFSPECKGECKVNNTTGEIYHKPTKSRFIVVSGDNVLSTEGYNGSLFVDETHVVDDALIRRLKRAGISRDEPVHIEMSTAGDNSDGYGYAQWETGKKVQSGEDDKRLNFLFMEFAVDQKTPVESFYDQKFVETIARRVNPAMGRIIRFNEYVQDWSDSRQSEKETREFAMYRCNLWLTSNVTWIPLSDWQKCAQDDYKFQDLMEMDVPVTLGLDISKTQDMTGLSAAFAVPHSKLGLMPHLWQWGWIPADTAAKMKGKKDLNIFRPELTIINKKAIDYHMVAKKINDIAEKCDFHGLAVDPWNADIIVGILMNDYGWSEDMVVAVRQTIPYMGPPTKEFERMVLREEIRYNGSKLLDWMIGHCYTHADKQGNLMITKPEPHDFRKVDLLVSSILAMAKMNNDPTIACNYTDSLLLLRDRPKPGRKQVDEDED